MQVEPEDSNEHNSSPVDEYPGDYSSRMEELLDSGEESAAEDTDFVYDGANADASGLAYKEQLADVLEGDNSDIDSDVAETRMTEDSMHIQDSFVETLQTANDVCNKASAYLFPTILQLKY